MPVVVYSVLRLLLLAVALGALWFAGLRGWLLVLVAAVVALMLSYLTLSKPREAASRYLAARAEHRARTGERFSREIEDDAAAEDAEADADADATGRPGTSPAR
ncbi:DUF4229 domain-containing protein [Cellulosimicrobium cellulans]|mgnify:FL=1|uniref:DUF4229 domain-containing protein n=1 Tax=Cellulosimicrobium TaxID=157920 RepID=UPI000882A3B2|nr:DUF4229 domain-containing protein [Sphaerisporangium cinnabarinum]MCR1982673.1 DUF4229 domain-containing protein [Cellulosimicrobium cellulans]PTU54745.1 DUF4229 domain-containing protein [Sphaerisporangium cinnabarinum]SDF80941.1 Protein of unknown function [Cellulosimicrobium cellulans]